MSSHRLVKSSTGSWQHQMRASSTNDWRSSVKWECWCFLYPELMRYTDTNPKWPNHFYTVISWKMKPTYRINKLSRKCLKGRKYPCIYLFNMVQQINRGQKWEEWRPLEGIKIWQTQHKWSMPNYINMIPDTVDDIMFSKAQDLFWKRQKNVQLSNINISKVQVVVPRHGRKKKIPTKSQQVRRGK